MDGSTFSTSKELGNGAVFGHCQCPPASTFSLERRHWREGAGINKRVWFGRGSVGVYFNFYFYFKKGVKGFCRGRMLYKGINRYLISKV